MPNIVNLEKNDLGCVSQLLRNADLPDDDIATADWLVLSGVRENAGIVAAGGLERCGVCLLLRSLVVSENCRGGGLGRKIVENLHHQARENGYVEVFLLTIDAERYFSMKFDYVIVDRDNVCEDIAQSNQFSNLCPGSAHLMKLSL